MRNAASLSLALPLLSLALFGCPKKQGEAADAAADAPSEAAVVDSGPAEPEATNSKEIARFGDETKLASEAAKTEAPLTYARKSPKTGEIVARLSRGTDVTKIAHRDTDVLVVFANPKKADEKLMGWVSDNAFKAPPAAAQKCKADKDCAATFVCVPHEHGTKCEKACSPTNTAACPKDSECKGEGPNAEGKTVQYCTSTLPQDAGAPTDGGAAKTDAGAPKADGGK